MQYFNSVISCLKRLTEGFSESYIPPGTSKPNGPTLKQVITDCSKQGKLLLLNLTNGDKTALRSIHLPEENFVIYTAPFNQIGTYETARFMPVSCLPFCGLFLCVTPLPADCTLLDTFSKETDLSRAIQHFMDNLELLMHRRDEYEARQENINIVVDQDFEFNRLEKEALEEQAREEREKLEQEKREKEIKELEMTVRARFAALPPEPSATEKEIVTLRCKMPTGETKTRSFMKSHPVQYLYDYVAIDTYPKLPVLKYGFPTKRAKELSKTFAQEGFAKKETVIVELKEMFEPSSDEEE